MAKLVGEKEKEVNAMEDCRLFENDIQHEDNLEVAVFDSKDDHKQAWLLSPYSSFVFLATQDKGSQQIIQTLLSQYAQGTRIYLVVEDPTLLPYVISEVEALLHAKGLRRKKDQLKTFYGKEPVMMPILSKSIESFSCFNFQVSVVSTEKQKGLSKSFTVIDGLGIDEPELLQELRALDQYSTFNLHQYRIEHADSCKNVQVRAGAGTGKTYAMISRIVYLCYAEGIRPADISDLFVMITFTVAAADNMKQRLKACFQNYYFLTRNPEFIDMISQVENMQICTIHSYARGIIDFLGSQGGYGQDIRITSSQYSRRVVLERVLEDYLHKKLEADRDYVHKLGIPIYNLRRRLLAMIEHLNNKSVDVGALTAEQFGQVENPLPEIGPVWHELISSVVPETEKVYLSQLAENNSVHLGNLMSILRILVQQGSERLQELQARQRQYMFVDEFQDTDDIQIETLLEICRIVGYKLFVVGDIKQCIYRFRGAEEMAFDRLRIEAAPDEWVRFVLSKNYRTDQRLLKAYQRVFYRLNAHPKKLLIYDPNEDALTSSLDLNEGLAEKEFYKCVNVAGRTEILPRLFPVLEEAVTRIKALVQQGEQLSAEELTIAILVRENWQADEVRKAGKANGFPKIITQAGGDLYQSAPALDLGLLLNTLLNNAHPEHLANLLTSNFFGLELNRRALYEMRSKPAWRQRSGEPNKAKQVNYLIDLLDCVLSSATLGNLTWSGIMKKLRTESILQVLRELYQALRPWDRYSEDEWLQKFYKLNVDLLFEKIIEASNVDVLTVHSLADFVQTSIVSKRQEDCRWPVQKADEINIVCLTVHKAKGLEYSYVILPYTDFRIDQLKKRDLEVSVSEGRIGYRMKNYDDSLIQNSYFNPQVELEERLHEETRILYVAMTRAIRSFIWLDTESKARSLSWQSILREVSRDAL